MMRMDPFCRKKIIGIARRDTLSLTSQFPPLLHSSHSIHPTHSTHPTHSQCLPTKPTSLPSTSSPFHLPSS